MRDLHSALSSRISNSACSALRLASSLSAVTTGRPAFQFITVNTQKNIAKLLDKVSASHLTCCVYTYMMHYAAQEEEEETKSEEAHIVECQKTIKDFDFFW